MKLTKMLGLALTTAIAAMAFIGAGTAAADSLCTTNVGHLNECKTTFEGLVRGLTIGGKLATLLNSSKESIMECHSTVLGETGENEGAHVGRKGLVTSLTFASCTGICSGADGINEPYQTLLSASKLTFHIETHENSGSPGALLTGCFGFANCRYELTGGLAVLDVSGDTLVASHEPLTRSGHSSLCPATGYWDATYLVTIDNKAATPLYATALP